MPRNYVDWNFGNTRYLEVSHPWRKSHLVAAEQMVQLFRREIPRQFGQEVVHVFHNRFVLPVLRSPENVEILEGQAFLFYHEAEDFLQLLNVLRLMEGVPQNDLQYAVFFDPFLRNETIKCERKLRSLQLQNSHQKNTLSLDLDRVFKY